MIMVTHDLGVVAKVCDRVVVMYAGKIVESAGVSDLFSNPSHPYTIALMNALPKIDVKADRLYTIEGQPPELHKLPSGCAFAPRCPDVMDICRQEYPPTKEVIRDRHTMSCWLSNQRG
jgi:oligopeptide/dipeptide ABC transporter ATP-binding protein